MCRVTRKNTTAIHSPDSEIQRGREAHPGKVGRKEQRSNTRDSTSQHHVSQNGYPESANDIEARPYSTCGKKHQRPRQIERELREPGANSELCRMLEVEAIDGSS